MAKRMAFRSRMFRVTARAILFMVGMAGLAMTKPAPAQAAASPLITICHLPGGKESKGRTIQVSILSVGPHLLHGDWLAACEL